MSLEEMDELWEQAKVYLKHQVQNDNKKEE